MRRRPTRGASAAGVSLIEAIVAMAVMAFGMMAIVGLQATLRLNSDIAKQRSEAVRIAQEAIEAWRAFTTIPSTAGQLAYADIGPVAGVQVVGYTTNTTYTLQRSVNEEFGGLLKSLAVIVSWTDRNGQPQRVELDTIIARIDPALSGGLSQPPYGLAVFPTRGRHGGIPPEARDMGDGISIFKPPGAPGGSVVWVFDNLSGVIVGVCNTITTGQAEITGADIQACIDNAYGMPLSGYVRFSTGLAQPTAADAENPTSLARNLAVALTLSSTNHPTPDHACYAQAPLTASTISTWVRYHCIIFFTPNAAPVWSGISTLTPLAFVEPNDDVAWTLATSASDPSADHYRVCRYTPATSDAQVIPNPLHPRNYVDATILEPLTNQNFLVIRAGNGTVPFTCPTDGPPVPANGDYVNSNTLPHQPPPAAS